MSKIRLNNFFFNEDGESRLETLSEQTGEKTGRFFLKFGSVVVIIILSGFFGFLSGIGKFGRGFKKGFK